MTDSIKVIEDDYVKRIHSSLRTGKLHKGHNVAAASASIPSRFQTIVIDNSDKKGFLSKSKRFNQDSLVNDNPGPGNYLHHSNADKGTPSFSKKGTGGFASKDRRLLKHQSTCSPGPLVYELPSMLVSRNDFNKAAVSRTFHKPIATINEKKSNIPAPNAYNILDSKLSNMKTNNVSAASVFKSSSKRDSLNALNNTENPAPWQYEINDGLVKPSTVSYASSFKSTSQRRLQPDSTQVPGPGTYKPHEPITPVSKLVFPKKHYLCISAPAMPLPKTPPAPGPGAYDVVDYDGGERHYMSGAVFVSNTSRWTGQGIKNPDFPGPAHYRPVEPGVQSFIYNANGRWI